MSRIQQCYISKSVSDFPFREKLGLTEYIDSSRPCLFIGCYTEYDLKTILDHQSEVTIFWCGQDAMTCIFNGWHICLQHCKHVTSLLNVYKALKPFINIELEKPLLLGGEFDVTPLGSKIFAYAPSSHSSYHRLNLIEQLQRELPYEFIIGDGSIPQDQWLAGEGNRQYDQCFIGLCLSGFAGGGQTVIHLGLKGRNVITNVSDLPNCFAWKTIDYIKYRISIEATSIGSINKKVAEAVKQSLK